MHTTPFTLFDYSPFSYSSVVITDDLEVQLTGVKFNQDFGCFHCGEWVQFLAVMFDTGEMVEYSKDGVRGRTQEFSLTAGRLGGKE